MCDDLFFVVKINDAAKRASIPCQFLKTADKVIEEARVETPLMIIVDLNTRSLDAVGLITKIRAAEDLKRIPVIGFVSHVEAELKQRAQSAGASMVLARSAFSSNLPQILKRHSGMY